MPQLQGSPRERFENDIKDVDGIVSIAADILYHFENALAGNSFDINAFESQILDEFELDDVRRLMFQRAISRYKEAILYTQDGKILEGFLSSTKLNLSAYNSIRTSVDPRRPGVIIIHIKDAKDADQFDDDIKSDLVRALERISAETGASITIVGQGKGFIGKSIDLETLGIDKDLPILGVIVVCDDVGEQTEKEGVTNHEYAHAVYKNVLQPFLHKYLSGAQFQTEEEFSVWTKRFSEEIRAKLFKALGDFSTTRSDRLETRLNAATTTEEVSPYLADLARDISARWGCPVKTSTTEEQIEKERHEVLYVEQRLLDELRAYGFSQPTLYPTPSPIHLEMRRAKYEWELGVMDIKIVERYFHLHMLALKSYYQGADVHLKVMSILGASQTLDQATRLVRQFLSKSEWDFTSKSIFDEFVRIVYLLSKQGSKPIYSLEEEENAVITNEDAVRVILPTKEQFEEAISKFYPEQKPEEVQMVLGLYANS